MTHLRFAIGALVMSGLVTLASAANADQYYGPRRVGDRCFVPSALGSNGAFGYWETCKEPAAATTGATANARIARPATKKRAANR